MNLYQIALNSLWRRKTRMIFLLIGLSIAVSTVIFLWNISRAMNADIAGKLDEYGANILIVPKTDDLALNYGGLAVTGITFNRQELHSADIDAIYTIKNRDNISIVAPKLLNTASQNNRTLMVAGVDFDAETRLKKWWKINGAVPADETGVLIGMDVKNALNISPGDRITISGESFTVRGILQETGTQDDGMVFMDLGYTQRLFQKPDAISLMEIAAQCYDCPIEEIVAQISAKLPGAKVTAISQTIEGKMTAMHQFEHFSLWISLSILLVGALIVFTTMSASVNDRRKEIGLFRSVGFRKKNILQIILLEALILSAIAGLTGFASGFVLSKFAAPLVGMISINITPELPVLAMALLLSVVVGVGAALYPSIRAAQLDPTTALRAL